MRSFLVTFALVGGGLVIPAAGQLSTLDWPVGSVENFQLDTGFVAHGGDTAATVFQQDVTVENAAWLRVYFGLVHLEPGSFVRITSLLDGETQKLDAAGMAAWGNASAYFNGDTVRVELIAAAKSSNRLTIDHLDRPSPQPLGSGTQCGICGTDDRAPSSHNSTARLLPAGCTATVFSESSCMVTAGHCIGGSMVVQFNVPNSNGNCSLNNPPVADQFPITQQQSINGGVGNDWGVLTPGTNSSGQRPFDRYGLLRPVAATPVSTGQTLTVFGYGVDLTCTRSQTQQTSSDQATQVSSSTITFEVDIRGGNSGSSILRNGEIVGIVTHCSNCCCPNFGTRVDLASFVAGRDALCGENLNFAFPGGLPELVSPGGGATVSVVVSADTAQPQSGTGDFHVSVDGGPFTTTAMSEGPANTYEAVFPSAPCGSTVSFYFSARTTEETTITSPDGAPGSTFDAVAAEGLTTVFADDFQSDQGWTISTTALDGPWQRAIPIGSAICQRGNPPSDGDGSGFCYVTDNSSANACNSDVDDGSTTLTSPLMDSSAGNAILRYWRWLDTTAGDSPNQDFMPVEISINGGATWSNLETVGPQVDESSGGWFQVALPVPSSSQLRVRFIAQDTNPQSVVEAGVDGVELILTECKQGAPCPWDCGGLPDGEIDIGDLLAMLAQWGQSGVPCDIDGAGVGINDLLALLANWGTCPN